jgi:hypothetical protein
MPRAHPEHVLIQRITPRESAQNTKSGIPLTMPVITSRMELPTSGRYALSTGEYAVLFTSLRATCRVRFVNFNMAVQRVTPFVIGRRYQLANLMAHAPCAFVGHTQLSLNFFGRNAVSVAGHQVDYKTPLG